MSSAQASSVEIESAQASAQRREREHWAAPGGTLDRFINLLKRTLPIVIAVLVIFLAVAPFTHTAEVSFVLDKNKVDMAGERMKVVEALYRGQDSKGRPFSLKAGSAVQKTSRDPIVNLNDLVGRMQLDTGGALVTAQRGVYDMDTEKVRIDGAVRFESADGYRMTTRDVDIALAERNLRSRGAVEGRIPAGTFRADHLNADLENHTVTLNGGARLRIEQIGRKGR
jgi:lipopolysaccharide export system protein LptC